MIRTPWHVPLVPIPIGFHCKASFQALISVTKRIQEKAWSFVIGSTHSPYCCHSNERPPKAFPCSIDEGPRKLIRVLKTVLYNKNQRGSSQLVSAPLYFKNEFTPLDNI